MPLLLIVVVLAIVFLSGFRIAQEYQRGVVFRLGRFQGLRGPGLFWIVPIGIERAVIIDIRTPIVLPEWALHVWIRAIKKGTITGERFS
jgi:regulator of protease activity HflC (stomatin/prohibitin superfamily)